MLLLTTSILKKRRIRNYHEPWYTDVILNLWVTLFQPWVEIKIHPPSLRNGFLKNSHNFRTQQDKKIKFIYLEWS
jgi:hypothetical protein